MLLVGGERYEYREIYTKCTGCDYGLSEYRGFRRTSDAGWRTPASGTTDAKGRTDSETAEIHGSRSILFDRGTAGADREAA